MFMVNKDHQCVYNSRALSPQKKQRCFGILTLGAPAPPATSLSTSLINSFKFF